MLVLLGIAVVVLGFIARINPLLVILLAAIVTGVAAAAAPGVDIRALGRAAIASQRSSRPRLANPTPRRSMKHHAKVR